ncbi:restriction endonuclease [Mycolicibacterium smegmatis]|uniref:Restriction endonuclease n=1 Tax=Mycolicibacterium smegmatis (strain MKD8) TaxID=1214915 RepID=A0A2U9PWP4_MYCSE|nr:restriction endonuclease [Mycolicibacterium smegmatis]AWT56212.1 Restriction endonuclease [Mycolicibacterium smegmatis MKD8]
MTDAWVIRSGRHGERDAWALKSGCSGGGWGEVPDLSAYSTPEAVAQLVAETYPGKPDGYLKTQARQLWALRGRIQAGSLIAMPMKTRKQIALGWVTGPYEYRVQEEDKAKRHVVPVDWQRLDLPRSAVKQDLLFTLGSALTIFSPSKNNAVARLKQLLEQGTDPGQVAVFPPLKHPKSGSTIDTAVDVDEPELSPDIEEVAKDQITSRIAEDFAGHDLATLVTALLTADGMRCTQSPPGQDGGIDIVAGRGILGLDEPIIVQVKSGSQVGSPVVSQLHGVMSTYGAKQGLLVAWGGLSKQAHDALKTSQLRVRLWQAADVVDAVLERYDRLDEEIRGRLPLKRVWMLADAGS